MNAATYLEFEATFVETKDELANAIEAAHARSAHVYANGTCTLIDTISAADFANWDGSDELAIVCDPDGLDYEHSEFDEHFGAVA